MQISDGPVSHGVWTFCILVLKLLWIVFNLSVCDSAFVLPVVHAVHSVVSMCMFVIICTGTQQSVQYCDDAACPPPLQHLEFWFWHTGPAPANWAHSAATHVFGINSLCHCCCCKPTTHCNKSCDPPIDLLEKIIGSTHCYCVRKFL